MVGVRRCGTTAVPDRRRAERTARMPSKRCGYAIPLGGVMNGSIIGLPGASLPKESSGRSIVAGEEPRIAFLHRKAHLLWMEEEEDGRDRRDCARRVSPSATPPCRFRPVSGLAGWSFGDLRLPVRAQWRDTGSFGLFTVAGGAAPVSLLWVLERTGFPFHPANRKFVGNLKHC